MLKAIFMDFYGTVVYETSPSSIDVIRRIYTSGNADSIKEVTSYWWKTYKEQLAYANGANYKTQHDMALDNFRNITKHYNSNENPIKLLEQMEEHWRTAPAYDDAAEFMDKVAFPVYYVTNSDDKYVVAAVKTNNLHPHGIVTSEQAKYSKPKKEIFKYALDKFKLECNEVIHIGDSFEGDVKCPQSIGIKAILLNRGNKKVPQGVESVNDLHEALEIIMNR